MIFNLKCPCICCQVHVFEKYPNSFLLNTIIKYNMNKHLDPLFQKGNFAPPGSNTFFELLHYTPKTFQLSFGVAGKEILTLSTLSRSCQFLPLSDLTRKSFYCDTCYETSAKVRISVTKKVIVSKKLNAK